MNKKLAELERVVRTYDWYSPFSRDTKRWNRGYNKRGKIDLLVGQIETLWGESGQKKAHKIIFKYWKKWFC